jgi:hypothetical protein
VQYITGTAGVLKITPRKIYFYLRRMNVERNLRYYTKRKSVVYRSHVLLGQWNQEAMMDWIGR